MDALGSDGNSSNGQQPRTEGRLASRRVVRVGSVDITTVRELWQELRQSLADKVPVSIDFSEATQCDTAVLQLLCAFVQEARAAGTVIEWHKDAPAISKAAAQLGLTRTLGIGP